MKVIVGKNSSVEVGKVGFFEAEPEKGFCADGGQEKSEASWIQPQSKS